VSEDTNDDYSNGLQSIVAYTKKIKAKYPLAGVADLIQFQAKIAIVTCPLVRLFLPPTLTILIDQKQGVRMRTFVGRPDSLLSNPPGLMPGINQDAQTLVNMFNAKTIGPDGLAALVGAHTSANQFFALPATRTYIQ